MHAYIYIYIYMRCEVRFWTNCTPLKVGFWTNLKVSFWTKMILAYFYSGSGNFCANVSVVCFGVCWLLSATFLKMAFLSNVWKKHAKKVFFWKQQSTIKKGFKEILRYFVSIKTQHCKKGYKLQKMRKLAKFPKSMRSSFWSNLGVFKICWNVYVYSVFSNFLVSKNSSTRSRKALFNNMLVLLGGVFCFFFCFFGVFSFAFFFFMYFVFIIIFFFCWGGVGCSKVLVEVRWPFPISHHLTLPWFSFWIFLCVFGVFVVLKGKGQLSAVL